MWSSLFWFGGSVLTVLVIIRWFLKKSWGQLDRNNEINVKGKLIVVTGANTGIGKATALELAMRDANVIMACRNMKAAKLAVAEIRDKTTLGQLLPMELDLASLNSIREFASEFNKKYDKLDILINNAGVLMPPLEKMKTSDGFEIHFGVNHLGHFLLTNLLLEPIKKAAPSRIVTLSSLIHKIGKIDFDDLMSESKIINNDFFANQLYANSKLSNALFSKELAKRLEGTGVRTYSLCPGMVITDMARHVTIPFALKLLSPLLRVFLKSPAEGCHTSLYCALSKNCAHESGEMYQHCGNWNQKDRIPLSAEDASKLWTISEQLVGLET